jgi:hypothetical protein
MVVIGRRKGGRAKSKDYVEHVRGREPQGTGGRRVEDGRRGRPKRGGRARNGVQEGWGGE